MNIGDTVRIGGDEFHHRGETGIVVETGSVSAISKQPTVKVQVPGVSHTIEYFVKDLEIVDAATRDLAAEVDSLREQVETLTAGMDRAVEVLAEMTRLLVMHGAALDALSGPVAALKEWARL